MADGPVTIADVAAAAGVSVATVSKVINDRYGVAEQTSARVREVIEQLGYTSSLVAQSLRSRRSNVIGVIASDIEPFNAELLKGAARGLRGTGYDLIVFSDCGRYEDQAGWEQRSLARVSALTDGSVLVTPSSVDVTSSRPLVAVDHNVRSTSLPTVDSDNLSGGATATEYLIGLGHRRIGFLAGRRDLESSRLRQQGYRRALETAGIPFDENLVRVGGYRAESAHTAARELLDRDDRPTAIFAANDNMAAGVLQVAHERGLTVPGDLSVVGFDDADLATILSPALTTVRQPLAELGRTGVNLLTRMLEKQRVEALRVELATRLVVRESTGPAPER